MMMMMMVIMRRRSSLREESRRPRKPPETQLLIQLGLCGKKALQGLFAWMIHGMNSMRADLSHNAKRTSCFGSHMEIAKCPRECQRPTLKDVWCRTSATAARLSCLQSFRFSERTRHF